MILYLSILLHAILNSLCIIEPVNNAINYFFFFHIHLKHNINMRYFVDYRLQTKQNNGLTDIKSKLLQQTPGNKIQFETSGRRPLWGEFYEIMGILIDFIILYMNYSV
jgi:hypothetical protein